VGRTLYIDTLDCTVAAALLELVQGPEGATRMAQLRVLGGAVARVAPDATAYAHRTSRVMLNIAVLYNRPEDAPAHAAWATTAAAALRQGDHRADLNVLDAEGEERIRAAYPGATWKRLREVKRRYDPGNLFRLNQNIPPSDDPEGFLQAAA